jgi:hypothetical protein
MKPAKIVVTVILIAAATLKALILSIPNNLNPATNGTPNVTAAMIAEEMITPSTEYMKFMPPLIKLDSTTPPSRAKRFVGCPKVVNRDTAVMPGRVDLIDDK